MKKKQSVSFWAGAIMAASIAAICIISFFWMPADPEKMDTLNRFALPSAAHLLGTDQFGRDVLSRIMEASRWALLVGVCSVTVGALAGSIIGASAAMLKGAVRAVIMRFIDGMMSFPGILLAMMLVTVLGKGILGAVLAIGLFMVPTFSRLVYSMVLENKQRLYIKAAHSYGCSGGYIVLFHMLPDMLPRLITQFSSSIGGAVLLESSLSFLGLGIQPPTPSWGMMLNEARQFVLNYPYIAIAPGVVLLITVLGFMALLDTTEEGSGFQERLLELLGEQHQEDHGGVFTDFGYAELGGEIKDIYVCQSNETACFHRSDAPVVLEVRKGFFNDPSYDNDKTAVLNLPAADAGIWRAVEKVDAASVDECAFRCVDCLIPFLRDAINNAIDDEDGIEQADEFAKRLAQIEREWPESDMVKYKALLSVVDHPSLQDATRLMGEIDQYELRPEVAQTWGYAEMMFREKYSALPEELFQTPQAAQIGQKMLDDRLGVITEYGLIRRKDGQPFPVFQPEQEIGQGLEMM